MTPAAFRTRVWGFYESHGRHDLPWRHTRDPYKILVSEIMLQQTQVERVIPFYAEFTKRFPTAKKLAAAPLADVLRAWQGLGYNRRAKQLRAAAKGLVGMGSFRTRLNLVTGLEKLPGVGPYTARAIAAFAFNQDVAFVETNIRTAVIHHFFSRNGAKGKGAAGMIYHTGQQKISDADIEFVLKKILPKGRAREWYWALMDYGSHLKRSGMRINARSAHYVKQSRFSGSPREARGAVLRELSKGPRTVRRLAGLLGDDRTAQLLTALKALYAERLVEKRRSRYFLAS